MSKTQLLDTNITNRHHTNILLVDNNAMNLRRATRSIKPMPVNIDRFAEMMDMEYEDSKKFLLELTESFIKDSLNQMLRIEDAIKTQNFTQLKSAEHRVAEPRVKGGADCITAITLSETCGLLEQMARNQRVEGADIELEKAKKEIIRLGNWLACCKVKPENHMSDVHLY
ncbi:MAG: HPt (histidine-containing phosphotransfer) domain-containing protein [Cellvibrionaceae bacterium]|jgi:HPt (histidine-containing phosphotransfer) domain-containing protein